MAWPVLWDPFNILGFEVVPVTYLLNPEGAVLVAQPSLEQAAEIERRILSSGDASNDAPDPSSVPPRFGPELIETPADELDLQSRSDRAVSLALWGDDLDEAVDELRGVAEASQEPAARFRLGVALRMRHDSALRRSGDFAAAASSWGEALSRDPNQYIWRRRLQQYGPRLSKPYPFYDWVPRARADIRGRGEEPIALAVEPRGAELVDPRSETSAPSDAPSGSGGDADRLVAEDEATLIHVETVAIPAKAQPGERVRLHLILTPNKERDAHWNNEAGFGELWVDPPAGWRADPPHQYLPQGSGDVSDETRHVEMELVVPEDTATSGVEFSGHVLYYVCEGRAGVCLYRRRSISIRIEIDEDSDTRPLAG